jgi:IS5 family transposase
MNRLGLWFAELSEPLRDDISMREARVRTLAQKRENRASESRPERPRFDRARVDGLESSKGFSGEVVVAARLHRRQPLAQARNRERVVAHGPT